MFVFVIHAGLVSFIHPFRFAVRLPSPLPLIFMMVLLSSGLNVFFLCKSFASFHGLTPHFPIPLHG
jgi:hypothetical protein